MTARSFVVLALVMLVAAPASAQESPLPEGFTRVSIRAEPPIFQTVDLACGAERAYARDWEGHVMEWDGATWTALPAPSFDARGQLVWVASDGAVVIDAGSSLARWNGRVWERIEVDPWFRGGRRAPGIEVLGGRGVPVVLGRGAIGAIVDGVVRPFDLGDAWYALWDVAVLDDVLVASAGGVRRWDGRAWSRERTRLEGAVFELLATSPSDVWALGERGVSHFDGRAWTRADAGLEPPEPSRRFPHAPQMHLGGASPDHVYVTTSDRVARWTGTRWETVLDASHRSRLGRGYGPVCATSRHVLLEDGGFVVVRAR